MSAKLISAPIGVAALTFVSGSRGAVPADYKGNPFSDDFHKAGAYRIIALCGNEANTFGFSINGKPATECKFPVATGACTRSNFQKQASIC